MLIAENELGELRYGDGEFLGIDLGPWYILRVYGQSLAFRQSDLPLLSKLLNGAWLHTLTFEESKVIEHEYSG